MFICLWGIIVNHEKNTANNNGYIRINNRRQPMNEVIK